MRFAKIELTWATSSWLVTLSPAARLCWIMTICYCKASGAKGRVKRLDPLIASRLWFVGEEDVRQMEIAAVSDGALIIESGDWIINNWGRYQDTDETAAIRQKRFREKQKEGFQARTEETVTDGNALRNANNTEESENEKRVIRDGELEEKEKKPQYKQATRWGLSRSDADAPPALVWWDKERSPEGQIIEALRSTKHYSNLNPSRSEWEELGLYVREFVPDKKLFACELVQLAKWVGSKRSRPWQEDPHAAMFNWFSRKEAEWRKLRAARSLDAKNGKQIGQEETLQEKAARVQARLEKRLEERDAYN